MMKATSLLTKWYQYAIDGDVTIDPRQINREANENLRYFGIPRRSKAPDVDAVEAFVSRVIAARREQLRARKSRLMTMYWWHDDLAGQLRCSLVCTSHRRLPFGVRIRRIESVRPILEEWLDSPWLHGIPFSDLVCDFEPDSEPDSDLPSTLRVWATVLRDT